MRLVIPSLALPLIATDVRAFAPRTAALGTRTQNSPCCRLTMSESEAESGQVTDIVNEARDSGDAVENAAGQPRKVQEDRRHRYHDLVTIVEDSAVGQPITPWEDQYQSYISGEEIEGRERTQAVARAGSTYQSQATSDRADGNPFNYMSHAENEFGGHSESVMDQPKMMQRENRRHHYDDLVHISDDFADQPITMQSEDQQKWEDGLVQVVDEVGDHPRMMWKDRHDTYVSTKGEEGLAAAAGVGAGVLGMMVAGPIGAVALGFSAAFAAEKEQGVVGDSARAVGDVALSAKAKASEIEEKHHVSHKARVAAGEAWEMAKELDREHKILQKAKDVAIYGSKATADYVHRHNLVERGLVGIGRGACWISERVASGSLSPDEDTTEVQSPKPSEMTVYKHIIG